MLFFKYYGHRADPEYVKTIACRSLRSAALALVLVVSMCVFFAVHAEDAYSVGDIILFG